MHPTRRETTWSLRQTTPMVVVAACEGISTASRLPSVGGESVSSVDSRSVCEGSSGGKKKKGEGMTRDTGDRNGLERRRGCHPRIHCP